MFELEIRSHFWRASPILTINIYVHSVIRLFNFIRKIISTSLYIVLDDWLEIGAIEGLFFKISNDGNRAEAGTYKDLVF